MLTHDFEKLEDFWACYYYDELRMMAHAFLGGRNDAATSFLFSFLDSYLMTTIFQKEE